MSDPDVRPVPRYTWRRFTSRHLPFVLVAGLIAAVVAVAPTTTPSRTNAYAGFGPTGRGQHDQVLGDAAEAGDGAAAGDAAAAAGVTGAAGPGSAGTGRAGAAAAAAGAQVDCTRQKFLGPNYPCKPAWSGGNGGATSPKGVTGSEIKFVFYIPPVNQQVATILQAGGATAEPGALEHEIAVYTEFFNRHIQTYGRKVKVEVFRSEAKSGDTAASRADGIAVDQKYKAFLSTGGTEANFLDETSRRGIMNIGGASLPNAFYLQRAPFIFGLLPTAEFLNTNITEYIVKRLGVKSTAKFGGAASSPLVNGQPRRYGIIYPTTNQDGSPSAYAANGEDMKRRLAAAGIQAAATIGYSLDINSATTQSTNIILQLQQAQVTTVLCLCDPIAPIFLTASATKQGYSPEWLQTGYLLQDADFFGRLYDQTQWSHDFGVSSLPVQAAPQETNGWKTYKSIDPDTDPPVGFQLVYSALLIAFTGIEQAGPTLNPRTFADGLLSVHIDSNGPSQVSFWYEPSDLGGIKDMQEVWWSPGDTGPDGKTGHYMSVAGGYRYRIGRWPASPTRVFDRACLEPGSCGAPRYP